MTTFSEVQFSTGNILTCHFFVSFSWHQERTQKQGAHKNACFVSEISPVCFCRSTAASFVVNIHSCVA